MGLSQPPFSSGYEHHLLRAPPGEVSGLWEMGWAGDPKQPLLIGAGRQVCWHLFSPVSPRQSGPSFHDPTGQGLTSFVLYLAESPQSQEPIAWGALP